MDWRTFLGTFVLVFLAELGDKTQLTTVLLAASSDDRLWVLLGAVVALCAAALLGVTVGSVLGRVLPVQAVRTAAGLSFVVLGLLLLLGRE